MQKLISLLLTCLIFLPTLKAQEDYRKRPAKVSIYGSSKDLNDPLPTDYTDRTFIRGLAGFRNQIDQLVGRVLLVEHRKKPVVLDRYVRENAPPILQTSISDVLYNSKINNRFRFNGKYMIGSVHVGTESLNELIVTDVAVVTMPDSLIPYLEICKALKNIREKHPDQERLNYYYVQTAKLTSIYSREYSQIESGAEINGGTVIGADGNIYHSTDNFKMNYVVSVDMVNLTQLLATQDCDQQILNEKLAQLEAIRKVREEAEKAKENELAIEAEFAALKSESQDLQEQLNQLGQELAAAQSDSELYKELLKQELEAKARVEVLEEAKSMQAKRLKVAEATADLKEAEANKQEAARRKTMPNFAQENEETTITIDLLHTPKNTTNQETTQKLEQEVTKLIDN